MAKKTSIKNNKLIGHPIKKPAKSRKRSLQKIHNKHIPMNSVLANVFMAGSIALLIVTTIFWSLLGAHVQSTNADQLIDPYLFQTHPTFTGAEFPSQHTFMFKWPLFFLVKLMGATPQAYIILTIMTAVATVAIFAYLLYRIEKRPLVIGTIFLMLSCVLLSIPAEPYPGALLPVNMAMLTTRNLEYVLYLLALVLVMKFPSLRNWRFWLAVIMLAGLFASDKLFLQLSLAASVVSSVLYFILRRKETAKVFAMWFVASLLAAVGSMLMLWALVATHLTNVTDLWGSGPYQLIHSVHQAMLGMFYGVLGVAGNFGANPFPQNLPPRQILDSALAALNTASSPAIIVNALILLSAIAASLVVLWRSIRRRSYERSSARDHVGVALIWTALASLGLFVVSDHYYAVDSRYLTIFLFAGFYALTLFASRIHTKGRHLAYVSVLLLAGISSGFVLASNTAQASIDASANVSAKNNFVAQILTAHPVSQLVGDYWRVVPIKQQSPQSMTILPLEQCGSPRNTLISSEWQTDMRSHSFAYLLSDEISTTGFKRCSYEQIVQLYGAPNSSQLIAGTIEHPLETLLFYDHGAQPASQPQSPATLGPLPVNMLHNDKCDGRTVLNIVAHQDDDLLFLNPEVQRAVTAGSCVRTVFVTAGDSGFSQLYWLTREHASRIAYDHMAKLAQDSVWGDRLVKVASHGYAVESSPIRNPDISLLFMHLPDGNMNGSGFHSSGSMSLQQLIDGNLATIESVDKQSSYSSDELVEALKQIIDTYRPSVILTQSPMDLSLRPGHRDHSDHLSVGRLVEKAYALRDLTIDAPISYYIGYPVLDYPANVTGNDLTSKRATFYRYAALDPATCNTEASCTKFRQIYPSFLLRSYPLDKIPALPTL